MLKVYNTLTKKKEVFRPRQEKRVHPVKSFAKNKNKSLILSNRVNFFVCGPTVYDFSHLGHARTYIAFDVIAKYLKSRGYNIFYLQNITDVDDKIIQRARESKVKWNVLAKKFEKEYFQDIRALKVKSVTKYARATDHIKEIISQVERLLKKGYAYQIEDGIYYNISKFKDYGKLSRRTIEQAEDAVSRIDEGKEKINKGDFCLWKFSKPGEPMWDFKTGKLLEVAGPNFTKASTGKPGWHIEDTAITEKYFGTQYDVHGGARDLVFPHHEAEIAQMEAISGKKPFVKYWMHTGFLTVGGQKMSKSLGNFITIRNFLKENPARALRFLVIKTHYRSPLDFNENLLQEARTQIQKFDEFIHKLQSRQLQISINRDANFTNKYLQKFQNAMDDDFNTPKALAAILALIKETNRHIDKNQISKKEAKKIKSFLKETDKIFGFIFPDKKNKIPAEVQKLVRERELFRQNKNWKKADELRKKIESLGYEVKDAADGPTVTPRSTTMLRI
jgi:cysteinyl-tRNA synthetase